MRFRAAEIVVSRIIITMLIERCGMNKSLSFGAVARLGWHAVRQNLFRVILTILLLSVCTAAFGVAASTVLGYAKKQRDLFYANRSSTFAFAKFDWSNLTITQDGLFSSEENWGGEDYYNALSFTEEEIEEIEAYTGLAYARIFGPGQHESFGVMKGGVTFGGWQYADYDRRASAESHNRILLSGSGESPNLYEVEYSAVTHADNVGHYMSSNNPNGAEDILYSYMYLPEEQLGAYGCKLLAGRMPRSADEIAINECMLNEFAARGYCMYPDIAAGELVLPLYNDPHNMESYQPNLPDRYILNAEDIPGLAQAYTAAIGGAEDMVGKQLALYGAPEGSAGYDGYAGTYYLATVVGVVDCGCGYDMFCRQESSYHWRVQDKIFVSADWAQACGRAPTGLCAPRNSAAAPVSRCLELHRQAIDLMLALPAGSSGPASILVLAQETGIGILLSAMSHDFRILRTVLLAGGALFGVFGALLAYALVSASAEKKRREIGVLKALGAKNRDVYRIFLAECAFVGACVFLLAMAAALYVVYGVFGAYTVEGVALMQIGGLQAAVLLVFGFGLPVGMGALCVRAILRWSPAEIVLSRRERGRFMKKQKGVR